MCSEPADIDTLQSLAQHLRRPGLEVCVWSRRLTEAEVDTNCADNPLWEAIDSARLAERARGTETSAAVMAAITLQDLLDEEMGGWPNTFG
mmetsp:Transcript_24971/g.67000  ORF Transcript_24971/g.67000 Transcript_24971/m.67000 type:complete len:91 (+) Transcript_24971:313-585(+)|eukprot:3765768-Prymnesium_polylepis.1